MKRAFAVASSVVGAAAFAYALHVIGVASVKQALARIGWGFALVLLISGLREAAKAAAWTQALTAPHRLSLRDAFRARLAGEALGALVPMGFIVGEPTKAQHVDDHLPFATAFTALMLDSAFYGASLAVLAGVTLLIVATWRVTAAVVVAGAALAAGAAFLPVWTRVAHAVDPLRRFVVQHPRRASMVAALQATYHALGIAEAYVILGFLNPTGTTWMTAAAFEVLNRGVTIVFKMVPMRVGVDEASAGLMATHLAIGPSTGVMLALVRKLRVLFWTAVGLMVIALRAIRRWAPARSCCTATLEEITENRTVLAAHSLPSLRP